MSKGRTQNSGSETQFLRSCWETIRDMDKVHGTYTRILLKPTGRTGVFDVEFDTWLCADNRAVGRLHKSSEHFPSAAAKTMAASLFSGASAHALRVEEAIRCEAADIMKHLFGG